MAVTPSHPKTKQRCDHKDGGKVTAHYCEKLALQLHEDLKAAAKCAAISIDMPMAKRVKVAPEAVKLMRETDMP